jgi:hypothetical protein
VAVEIKSRVPPGETQRVTDAGNVDVAKVGLVFAVAVVAIVVAAVEDMAASLEVDDTVEIEDNGVDSSCCETVVIESVDMTVVVEFICGPTTVQLSDRAPSIATPAATALSPLQKRPSFEAKM